MYNATYGNICQGKPKDKTIDFEIKSPSKLSLVNFWVHGNGIFVYQYQTYFIIEKFLL